MTPNMLNGIKSGLKYEYLVILCKPNKEELMFVQYSDLTFKPVFKEFNQLDIVINRLIGYYDGTIKTNPAWNSIKSDYLIHLKIKCGNSIIYCEYFVIENPQISSDEMETKSIQCYSYEKASLNNKILEGIKEKPMRLYSPTNETDSTGIPKGILNLICDYKLYKTWQVRYIDQQLLELERILNFSGQNLTNVISIIEEAFKCVIIFDNINMKIDIYEAKIGMLGKNKGLVVADRNLIKSINYSQDTNGIKTRLFMNGKNNTVITKYNPTGQRYVDDFSFYMTTEYMSQQLIDALKTYNTLIKSKTGLFESYLIQLESSPNNNDILNAINQLKDDLLWENNFTNQQIDELTPFIKEDIKTINQISDAKQLYEYSLKHLKTISFIPVQISIDSVDLFSIENCQLDWSKMEIGDFINIYHENLEIIFEEMRLISYTHNPVNNTLSMDFSNIDEYITKQWDDFVFINTVMNNSQMVNYEQDIYREYSNDKGYINNSITTLSNTITELINVPYNLLFNSNKNRLIINKTDGLKVKRIVGSIETDVLYFDSNGFPKLVQS